MFHVRVTRDGWAARMQTGHIFAERKCTLGIFVKLQYWRWSCGNDTCIIIIIIIAFGHINLRQTWNLTSQ